MAGERREAKTMSVELAIQRELAYRKRVSEFLSQEEIASLLPLKAADDSINCDKASELEKDGWKLVRIDEEGKGIPFLRSNNNGQASFPALEGPKLKVQPEIGRSAPSSSTHRKPVPLPALEGPKLKMPAGNGKPVPSTSTYRNPAALPALEGPKPQMQANNRKLVPSSSPNGNPVPKPTHVLTRQDVMSLPPLPKPAGFIRPNSISSRTIATANGTPVSAPPNPKPSPFSQPTENQITPHPGMNFFASREAASTSSSSPNWLAKPSPYASAFRNGPDLFCKLCKVDCSSPFNYKQHLKGQKHRANLRFKPQWMTENSAAVTAPAPKKRKCELCAVWCSDETLLQLHFKGRKHQEKLLGGQKPNAAQQQHHWCSVCEIPCINRQGYEQHLMGKSHAFHLCSLRNSSGQEKRNA